MVERDDDTFHPRPGPPRDYRSEQAPRFVNRVLKASGKVGGRFGTRLAARGAGGGAGSGRGHAAARMAGRGLDLRSRRMAVKFNLVNLKKAGPQSVIKHLRYIEREGIARAGEQGRMYGPDIDEADAGAFERVGKHDRHQFRIILSAEDGLELDDLRAFTRAHMKRVEQDLGTRLEWVAVDHWDTAHPHTHIVVRGKNDRGRDLVIARDYIGYGMRARASELATEWLGPRTQREIDRSLQRAVTQERWTDLDRALVKITRDGKIDLHAVPGELAQRRRRAMLVGRLQYLSELGLAEKGRGACWTLRSETERTLRAMGERGDIVRTMQRVLIPSRDSMSRA
jgi:Type IV secretory pathway, VirD2 components (relaxase)